MALRADGFDAQQYAALVDDNFFSVLGVQPMAGRLFVGSDETGAIISAVLWERAFANRPLENGLRITAGDRTYTVVGVMPAGMREPVNQMDLWLRVPRSGLTEAQRTRSMLFVRLRPGMTMETARAELALAAKRLTETHGAGRQPFSYQLYPMAPTPEVLSVAQKLLAGASLAILLIACVNLTNLMLARGISRRPELALRLAIGATRPALVRHVLSESIVIAVAGGLLGTVLTVWGVGLMKAGLPQRVFNLGVLAPHTSWRVYGFALAVTALSVLVFGLLPALRASDVSLTEPIKEGTGTGRGGRYSRLVIAEVAVCLVLLMTATMLLRTLQRMSRFDFGYDAAHVMTSYMNLSRQNVPGDSAVEGAYEGLLVRLLQVPGAVAAATTAQEAPRGGAVTSDVETANPLFASARSFQVVSHNYLRVLGISVIDGRDFEVGDGLGNAPVAVIDQNGAKRLWPGASPVGRMIKLGNPGEDAPWVRVIGVAQPVDLVGQMAGRDEPLTNPQVYVVRPHDATRMRSVVVRFTGDAEATALALRRGVFETYSRGVWGGAVFRPIRETFDTMLSASTFMARVFSSLGALALLLTAVGIYGVLAYAVSRRMREFAVRIALGAESRALLGLVFREGAVLVLAGTAIGATISVVANALESWFLITTLPPTDALSIGVAEGLLLLVAFAACLIPAVRATRADPLEILRSV